MRAEIVRQGSATARRRRSVSANRGGLAGRLGVNPTIQQQGTPRRRLNRGNLGNQQRSNSRSRSLVRSNSQARLASAPRSNSRAREPSVQRRGREPSVQRRGREPSVQRRGRSASRGRRPVVVAQTQNNQNPRAAPRRGRSASRGRQPLIDNQKQGGRVPPTPISARLGLNRNRVAGGQRGAVGGGVARGRIQKRAPVIVRGKKQNTAQNRVDRSTTRYVFLCFIQLILTLKNFSFAIIHLDLVNVSQPPFVVVHSLVVASHLLTNDLTTRKVNPIMQIFLRQIGPEVRRQQPMRRPFVDVPVFVVVEDHSLLEVCS